MKVIVSLWDGTVMYHSLAERKLPEAYKSEVMDLGKGVPSLKTSFKS